MSEHVIAILVANAPLVAALTAAYLWATPRTIKSTLMNGGGEIVRRIVKEENVIQSDKTHESIGKAVAPLTESVNLCRERIARLEGSVGRETP